MQVSVVFIHTMEGDQRLNTLVYKSDTLHFSLQQCKTYTYASRLELFSFWIPLLVGSLWGAVQSCQSRGVFCCHHATS